MGHFFSRAIKRFTQCNSGAQQQQLPASSRSDQVDDQTSRDQTGRDSRPTVEAISVGQSIDSADYVGLNAGSESGEPAACGRQKGSAKLARISEKDESSEMETAASSMDTAPGATRHQDDSAQSSPAVEEAVIKIQALVRGHLTRKALKDAQQQAATPAPNALGQSQFDAESLTRNPPSAVLSTTSPLNTSINAELFNDQVIGGGSGGSAKTSSPPPPSSAARVQPTPPPLESIAEESGAGGRQWPAVENLAQAHEQEQQPPPPQHDQQQPQIQSQPQQQEYEHETSPSESTTVSAQSRRKLAPINRSLALSGDMEQPRAGSISPALSECQASIDLACDTPASASIDILDHSLRAADALASVLHHKEATAGSSAPLPSSAALELERVSSQGDAADEAAPMYAQGEGNANGIGLGGRRSPRMVVDPPPPSSGAPHLANSHSIDSAEAAAIRIQSAYRGYHTRKHSPYRRRSPNTAESLDAGTGNGYSNCIDVQAAGQRLGHQLTTGADDYQEESCATSGQPEATNGHEAGRRPSRQRHRSDDPALAPQATDFTFISGETEIAHDASGALTAPSSSSMHLQQQHQHHYQHESEPKERGNAAAVAAGPHSFELDTTESSLLGAALSLNESSEAAAVQAHLAEHLDDERQAREARRLVEQLTNEDEDEQHDEEAAQEVEAEAEVEVGLAPLQRHQLLDAALESATDELEAPLEVAVAQEHQQQQQHNFELESDELERRHPSGRHAHTETAPLDQPALVAANSLEDEENQPGGRARPAEVEPAPPLAGRLAVESPDEAIGSGRSSPALISSNGSSEEADDDDEGPEARPGVGKAGQQSGQTAANGGQAGGGRRRRNRNKKKGRK